MLLPKKLGCDVVVKVPVPLLVVYNAEDIVRDGSSSDVMALETLLLPSLFNVDVGRMGFFWMCVFEHVRVTLWLCNKL
jgi:hypothetical protein